MKKILVCSPTYNESENIKIFCKKIFNINKNLNLLIIDDNSPDKTYEIVKNLKKKSKNLHLIKRKGKLGLGSAIREGITYALKKKYDALITLDADLSHDPKEIPNLIKNLKSNDFIIGSRYINGGSSDYVGYRDLISRLANKLMSQIAKDTHQDPAPLDNSYDYCAFGLSSNRTKYNKASGQHYNE